MLQKSLEDRGLKFLLAKNTQELVGDDSGHVQAIRFTPRAGLGIVRPSHA